MEPLAVDLMLLRSLGKQDLRIAPGRSLMARVVRAGGDPPARGALSIAGIVIEADLPQHLHAGQEVRLSVREVHAGKVVMSLSDQQPAATPTPSIPLPGGGSLRVTEDPSGQSKDHPPGTYVLSLRYDAPALGPVDLRFQLDSSSLQLAVALAAGRPFERAQAQAGELRSALASGIERTTTVTVAERHDPLDLYA